MIVTKILIGIIRRRSRIDFVFTATYAAEKYLVSETPSVVRGFSLT